MRTPMPEPPASSWVRRSLLAVFRHRWRLAVFVGPWILALCVGFPLMWYQIETEVETSLLHSRDESLRQTVDVLDRVVDRLGRDVLSLSNMTARLPSDDLSAESVDAQLFLGFAASTPDYDQVRWIGEDGTEKLRINHRGGAPVVAPRSALQNKASRPYFKDAIDLPQNGVYISELDLNVERGVVEKPIQPMLRVAAPVFTDQRRNGVVVINYRAGRLLDQLDGLENGSDVYLVNTDGYWIQGPNPDEDWGWQLGAEQPNLPAAYPGLWKAMQGQGRGDWHDKDGYWAFQRLDAETALLTANEAFVVQAGELGFYVLARVQSDIVASREARGKIILSVLAVLLAAMTAAITIRLANSLEAESERTRELQHANLALTEANEHLRLAQAELARAERLSSLGLMVAGVAHELNTPLGSAKLSLSKAEEDLATLESCVAGGLRRSELDAFLTDSKASLGIAHDAVGRCSDLVRRFKQVAVDRATLQRRKVDLAGLIRDADPRIDKWDASTGIVLKVDLEPDVAMNTYPGPLGQVISNLLTNAVRHAFPEGAYGTIAIRARADGPRHALIDVEDDGRGIPADALKRVFEPFFTTARHAGGTGLGLHIAHQTVTEVLGGTLSVESPVSPGGTGTRFSLRLPRVAPVAPDAA